MRRSCLSIQNKSMIIHISAVKICMHIQFLLSLITSLTCPPHLPLPLITSLWGLMEATNWKVLISGAAGVAAEHGLLEHVRRALPRGPWCPLGAKTEGWVQISQSLVTVCRKATCLPGCDWATLEGKTLCVVDSYRHCDVFLFVWHDAERSMSICYSFTQKSHPK